MSDNVEKVVIIGSGPAGLTAAIYAARANMQPLMFEGFNAGGLIPGGQLMFTTDVENYPGFPEGVTGPVMMKSFRDQAERFGTRFIREDVTEVDFSQRPFRIKTDGSEALAHSVIISTGARANWLGLDNEKRLAESGGGVSACAVCDGAMPIYRDQRLVVVGGGDSAIEEASYLTKFASKVHLMVRRDVFRASQVMQDRAFKLQEEGKLEIMWNHEVIDVLGDTSITGVKLLNNKTNEQYDFDCKGMFLAIGHTPNTDLFVDYIELEENKYIKLVNPGSTNTSVEGIYASGDVADFTYRQAVTAAGTGCMAALDAERWLAAQGID